MDKKLKLFVLIFFFFSGLSGLIYEILWTKMIVKIIGGAPFAVSIILTIFMGGLGLGSYLASLKIDSIKDPLKLLQIYGKLELIIGAYGLALPLLISVFKPLQTILYNQLFNNFLLYNISTFILSFILLAIPVICMGATLPILCRFYATGLSHLGTQMGRLYGLNTVGAAAGALACGFWLINLLGITGTLIFAVLINSIIGFSCLIIYSMAGTKGKKDIRSFKKNKSPTEEISSRTSLPASKIPYKGALVIFIVTGFCAMAYEVIWIKLLGLIVGPTTYSFTIVLVTFITGLALGSMIFGWLADKTREPIKLLVFTQISAALLVLIVSQLLGNSQLFFAKLIFNLKDQFVLLILSKALLLFSFMILPTLCLGAAFPLVIKIYTQSIHKVGKSIGVAYSLNTVGAVLGSFCAGFIIIPLLGKENGMSYVVAFQIFTTLVVAGICFVKKSRLTFGLAAVFAISGLIFCLNFPDWNHRLLSSGKYYRFSYFETAIKDSGWIESLLHGPKILEKYDRGKVIYYGEGIGGFTSVIETPDALGNMEYSMTNSGKMDASSRGDMKTQTLCIHFPLLFHPAAKSVMILGLASGITAGEALYYPIENCDVLEINHQVVEASQFFLPWNNDVLSSSKTNLIIQDARAHLQLTHKKYDVIVSEPSNPWMAGLATLFTRNMFDLAKKKLNNSGIFVQWLHSYNMDWDTLALIGRTFAQVFPHSILISTSPFSFGRDYLLIGFKEKTGLDLDIAEKNLVYLQNSKNVILRDPKLLFRFIVSEDLQELFGKGPINTDNRPRLEYAAPKLMHLSDEKITQKLASKKVLSPETNQIVSHVLNDVDAQIDFARYALSLFMPFPNMVDLSKATSAQKELFFKLMETYCSKNVIDYSILMDSELQNRCRLVQIEAIENKIDLMPDKAGSTFYLANLYLELGHQDEAIHNYSLSLQLWPNNAYAHNNLGYLLILEGKFEKAISHFIQAIDLKHDFPEAYRNKGFTFTQQGKYQKAAEEYQKAIHLLPENHTLHNDLGVILSRLGKLDEAIKHFQEAVRIKPDFAEAQRNLRIARQR